MTPINRDSQVVLIVDDVPNNLSLLHDMLDGSGYTVLVATDGYTAIERAQHITPQVILLDALMPGIDGFETCRRLKADVRTRHIPVIFMTGLTDSEHVVMGFEAGGVDYVTKPIRPEEVLARISSHVRNSRLVEQTRHAIDAAGQAVIALNASGEILWQTNPTRHPPAQPRPHRKRPVAECYPRLATRRLPRTRNPRPQHHQRRPAFNPEPDSG